MLKVNLTNTARTHTHSHSLLLLQVCGGDRHLRESLGCPLRSLLFSNHLLESRHADPPADMATHDWPVGIVGILARNCDGGRMMVHLMKALGRNDDELAFGLVHGDSVVLYRLFNCACVLLRASSRRERCAVSRPFGVCVNGGLPPRSNACVVASPRRGWHTHAHLICREGVVRNECPGLLALDKVVPAHPAERVGVQAGPRAGTSE